MSHRLDLSRRRGLRPFRLRGIQLGVHPVRIRSRDEPLIPRGPPPRSAPGSGPPVRDVPPEDVQHLRPDVLPGSGVVIQEGRALRQECSTRQASRGCVSESGWPPRVVGSGESQRCCLPASVAPRGCWVRLPSGLRLHHRLGFQRCWVSAQVAFQRWCVPRVAFQLRVGCSVGRVLPTARERVINESAPTIVEGVIVSAVGEDTSMGMERHRGREGQ